jgi:hypothetical protein
MSARVLFFTPYGEWKVHNQVDAVLAHGLKLRGADIRMVRCDGIYPTCDVLAWSGALAKARCARCSASGSKLFASLDLPILQMRDYLTAKDFTEAAQWLENLPASHYSTAEWNRLPLGTWVISSVFSHFRITESGLDRQDVRSIHRRYLENGLLTWLALSRIVDDFQPDRLVIFNGRMAPFRVALELAKHKNIPFITHERGVVDDSFIFYENEDCLATKPIYDCADRWRNMPLSQKECLEVKDYLASREHGKGMNYPSFYTYSNDYASVRHTLRIPQNAKVLLVLTSSEFEFAQLGHSQRAYDQLKVLDRLIELFRHREEFLVVRHHPHLAGSNLQTPPELNFITRAYRQSALAPQNVRVIMPSEPLSSYALFWNVDACVSFTSTAGVEALARGLPTASFPVSFYRQIMTRLIEQNDKKALDTLVNDLFQRSKDFGNADLRQLYRFMHSYIAKLSKRFKSFGIKNHFQPDLRFRSSKELGHGHDEELDIMCEHLLTGAFFWAMPSAQDLERNMTEESIFLQDQIDGIIAQRTQVRRESSHFSNFQLSPTVTILRVERAGDKPFTAWPGQSFRYPNVRDFECPVVAEACNPTTIRAIVSALTTIREDYVLITSNSVRHDESLIGLAVDQFLDDTDIVIDGILYGAWLTSADGDITGEIFTERTPAESYDEAVALLPALRNPEALLSFGLFRKHKLLELLQEISQLNDAETASRGLFRALKKDTFRHKPLPLSALTNSTMISQL